MLRQTVIAAVATATIYPVILQAMPQASEGEAWLISLSAASRSTHQEGDDHESAPRTMSGQR